MTMTSTAQNKTIRTPRSESKTAKAAEIFQSMQGAKRQEVISRFTNDLGLTPKGASTYYQTCRDKAGLVQHRGAPTA
jgi:hypothetical protein